MKKNANNTFMEKLKNPNPINISNTNNSHFHRID